MTWPRSVSAHDIALSHCVGGVLTSSGGSVVDTEVVSSPPPVLPSTMCKILHEFWKIYPPFYGVFILGRTGTPIETGTGTRPMRVNRCWPPF